MNSAGQLGGFVCSVLFGYLVQAWGNYYQPLWLVAFMVMVAALLFTRIDPTRPLVAEDRVPDSGPRQSMDRQPAHR